MYIGYRNYKIKVYSAYDEKIIVHLSNMEFKVKYPEDIPEIPIDIQVNMECEC